MSSYTDKSTVEKYLDVTLDANQTSFVVNAIAGVEDFINNYCKRKFDTAGATATKKLYDGNGLEGIVVDDFIEITSLSIDGVDVDIDDLFLYPANEDTKYLIELKNTLPKSSRNLGGQYFIFDVGQQNVEVEAKFGFKAIPDAIKLVATRLAGALLKEATGGNSKETTSESFLDYKVTYQSIKDIANAIGVIATLDQYIKPNAEGQRKSKSGYFQV